MTYHKKTKPTLDDLYPAFEHCGSQAALARRLGVTGGTVSAWYCKAVLVPFKHMVAIEKMTKGKVKALSLRPDLIKILKKIDTSILS